MAGPTCSVLIPASVAPEDIVSELIRLVGGRRDEDDFWVCDTDPIGGTYRGVDRPFILFNEPLEPEILDAVAAAIGWRPLQEIGIAAMCNGDEDHRILAELALWLADRTSGVVDLGGDPSVPFDLAGRVVRVPYDTLSGWEAHVAIVDAAALRAWLTHPRFRMVK